MISLIVCTRNRALQLHRMLAVLLGTDFVQNDVEVVLVDSGSTDDTPQVIAQFVAKTGARTVRVERPGLGLARNAGIERSSGRLLVFTDDDCYLAAAYFGALRANFDSSRCQYGMGSVLLFDPGDDRRVANYTIDAKRELPPYSLLPAGAIQGANMFFLRDVFERAGLFDPRMGAGTPFPCEDIEMATRASLAGFTGVQLPEPVVYHHHGRKAGSPEAEETIRQYDSGRGAYYASLLSRGAPAVWDLWKAGTGPLGSPPDPRQLERLERELDAAHRLLRRQGEPSHRRVAASHPHWNGFLLLSNTDDTVLHEGAQSRGKYRITGRVLSVDWERYPPEDFIEVEGVYTYQPLPSGATPAEIRSFDIFDTLVARRCVAPHGIFDAVEKKSGFAGFAELRRGAEAELYGSGEYTLDDIYRRMVVDGGLSEQAALRLKALELEEEFSNLMPVAQHVTEVRPSDLLVSDMYLPKSFIARVVREKCGLYLNPIYLSSHGKSSGKAWDVLSQQFRISLHTGDNPHSDVAMSQQRGIPSRHTAVTAVTEHEQTIESLGYRGLARAVREARLAYWHTDPELLWIGRMQIELNFPLLVLTALRLLSIARTSAYENVLFSARDCYLLFLVFQRLADRLGEGPHAEYFMTSRIARAAPSPAYLSYLNSLSRGRTLVVDLCGTGWSLTRLLEVADRSDIDIFLMQYLEDRNLMQQYRQLGEITRPVNPLFITRQGSSEVLEALNTASHEMIVDVAQVQDIYVPVFLEQQPDPRFSELVVCGERAMALALECTERIDLLELRSYVDTVSTSDIETCYRAFHRAAQLVPRIAQRQHSENQYLAKMLHARGVCAATAAP